MKLSNKDLQELYKAHIMDRIPKSRQDCPSPKKIQSFFRSRHSEKKKTKIIDHIVDCSLCMKEFELLLEIYRNEREIIQDIKRLHIFESGIKYKKTSIFSPFFPFVPQKLAWVVAGSLLLIVSISVFIIIQQTNSQEYQRSASSTSLLTYEPRGEEYSKSSLLFKWSEIENLDYYFIEVYDETLFPVWKSERIFTNQFIPNDSLMNLLSENKAYFWSVTAFSNDGKSVESRINKFSLTR